MKLSTIIIFLSVLYKYSQLYIGNTINIISIGIVGIIIGNIIMAIKNRKINNSRIFLILGVISIVITVLSKDPNFILPFLLAVLLQVEEPKKMVNKFFWSYVIMFIITIILVMLGIRKAGIGYGYDSDGNYVIRNALGFGYPNTTAIFLFGILVCYYLKKGKLKLIEQIVMSIIIIVFYYYTKSRTGLLVSILFVLTVNLTQKISHRKVCAFILRNSFFILTIISIIIALKCGVLGNSLNKILSNRPIFWKINLENGFSLLGKNSSVVLDNFMLVLLLQQGIIIYIIYAYLFYNAIKCFLKDEEYTKYAIVIFYTLIYGMTEAALNISNNIFLLLIFIIYFNRNFKRGEKEKNEKSIVFNK